MVNMSMSNMVAETVNISGVQSELPQTWSLNTSQSQGVLPNFLVGWSTWQYIVTFLLGVVVYDQGNRSFRAHDYISPS